MERNMTVGNPIKLIVLFALPMFIGNLFQQLYGMVDSIVVGQFIGTHALAAIGITGSLTWLVLGFTEGMTTGFNIVTAQRFGSGDYDGMRHAIVTTAYLGIVMTVLMTAVGMAMIQPMLVWINTPEELMGDALAYITIIFGGMGLSIFYNLTAGVMRALGDSKSPLYFLIIASFINIILDLVFVLWLHMGVAGTAVATIISQGISFVLSLIYMLKRYHVLKFQKKDFALDFRLWGKLCKLGLPTALASCVTSLGVTILQGAINTLGSDAIAANTAAGRVEWVAQTPVMMLGLTMATYVAQNLGAKKLDRVHDGLHKCLKLALVVCVVMMGLVYLLARPFIGLFIKATETNVIDLTLQYVWTVTPFLLVLTVLFVYRYSLQGMGDTMTPMVSGFIELVCRIIIAYAFIGSFGYTAICWSEPFAWVFCTIPVVIVYYWRIKKFRREYDLAPPAPEEPIPVASGE